MDNLRKLILEIPLYSKLVFVRFCDSFDIYLSESTNQSTPIIFKKANIKVRELASMFRNKNLDQAVKQALESLPVTEVATSIFKDEVTGKRYRVVEVLDD